MYIINRLKELSVLLVSIPNSNWQSKMPKYSLKNLNNKEIIEGIRLGSPKVFKYLKIKSFPFVLKYIKLYNGTSKEAEEVFQDALVVIFRKIKDPAFCLNCQFTTYFNSVCKCIWKFEQQKGNNSICIPVEHMANISDEKELEDLYRESKEFQLYRFHFKKLKNRQQKILSASLSEKKYSELYLDFGYTSVDAFKNEVYRIKKLLINQISSDPRFKKYNGKTNWSL